MVRAAPGRGWRRVKDRPGFARRGLERLPDGSPLRSPERLGRDLGLGAVSSLGLNEGVEGPFPAALAALERLLPTLNRYPGRGSLELSEALAERLGVDPAQLFVCAGADAAIGYVCQAVLEPGDEAVTAWPSFPSFVSDTLRRDAVPVRVALRDDWSIDLDALQAAVTDRTRLVFVATPNNPTGLALGRDEVTEFVDALPAHVVTVLDEAYFDYLDPATRLDGGGTSRPPGKVGTRAADVLEALRARGTPDRVCGRACRARGWAAPRPAWVRRVVARPRGGPRLA